MEVSLQRGSMRFDYSDLIHLHQGPDSAFLSVHPWYVIKALVSHNPRPAPGFAPSAFEPAVARSPSWNTEISLCWPRLHLGGP